MATPSGDAAAIEAEVLARIRPDAEMLARLAATRERLVTRAVASAQERQFPLARSLVAGSAARGTFVRDRVDIDLFLLFPPGLPRSELERMGLELGRSILEAPQTRYAEHPYARGTFEGFAVDAVPGYAIEDSGAPLTAVDRTPFHQAYLTARETPELVDQVRLAKQFLRGLDVYGSEARRGGFSGYLVELLVLRFGSLDALLAEARGWRIPVRLASSPRAAPRVPDDVALILDDPVDEDRNVATALSRRNLATFVLAAGAYLDAPSARYFALTPPARLHQAEGLDRARARGTYVTGLALARPDLVDEIIYPQLRKAERAVAEEATRLGFGVVGSASAAVEPIAIVLLEVEARERPVVRVRDGPPPGIERVGEFLEKWTEPGRPVLQGPYVTGEGKLAVEVPRETRDVESLLDAAMPHLPLGKDLKPVAAKGGRFLALAELPDGPALEEALGELLAKRLPWLGPSA